jgi:hypothetical protein
MKFLVNVLEKRLSKQMEIKNTRWVQDPELHIFVLKQLISEVVRTRDDDDEANVLKWK